MFDLEKSISEWRQQMLAAGIKTPVPLEELEEHLREEIERQMKSRSNSQQAFESAIRKIGDAPELKREFKKTGEPLETRFVKLVGFAVITIAFLFSLWIFPFLFTSEASLIAKALGLAAVATTALSWRYNHKLLPAIGHPWARAALGVMGCIAGLVWMRFFVVDIMPNFLVRALESETLRGWFLASFLWVLSVTALLGGIIHGLDKAARREAIMAGS